MSPTHCPHVLPGDVVVMGASRRGNMPSVYLKGAGGLCDARTVPAGARGLVLDASEQPWMLGVLIEGRIAIARVHNVTSIERRGEEIKSGG